MRTVGDPDDRGLEVLPGEAEPEPRRRRGRGMVTVLFAALLVLVLVVAGLVVAVPRLQHRLAGPPDYAGPGDGRAVVTVDPGESLSEVGAALVQAHVVKSRQAFAAVAAANPKARRLQPGSYQLRERMSAIGALGLLLDPSSRLVTRVTVPEGSTAEQVVDIVAAQTDIPKADLAAQVANPSGLGLPAYAKDKVEGLLFPATYEVEPGDTARDVLSRMVTRFKQAAANAGLGNRPGATPYQTLITASLVQAEAKFPEDFGKVARVVDNRLAAGMPLQFDSTINYAREERKRQNLSLSDLELKSPYNTYKVTGLPPTPIGNPGEAALQAAISPTPGAWLYFVTVDAAGHNEFAVTYDDFLALKAKGEKGRQQSPSPAG